MARELTDADYQHLLDLRTGLRRFLRWSEEQAAEAGLTPAQHQLLLAIRGLKSTGAPGTGSPLGPTIGDVAETLLLRHHSAVGLVDRAVKAGLVTRQEDAHDRRVVRLRLTALGNDLLTLLSAAHLEELERLAPRMLELWP
jgi:DNA-binding MarR family transcriptional regulator